MLCLLLVEIIVYKYTHKLIFIDSLKHLWVYLVTVCNTKSYQVYPKNCTCLCIWIFRSVAPGLNNLDGRPRTSIPVFFFKTGSYMYRLAANYRRALCILLHPYMFVIYRRRPGTSTSEWEGAGWRSTITATITCPWRSTNTGGRRLTTSSCPSNTATLRTRRRRL